MLTRPPNLRAVLRWFWIRLLAASGMLRWAQWQLARRNAVVVLTFHRVLSDDECRRTNSPAGMIVRQRTFEQLLGYVSSRFQITNVDGQSVPAAGAGLRFVFTFDDGWSDNCNRAAPLARQYDVPLTIFLCPDLLGRPQPFWPEKMSALWRQLQQYGNGETQKKCLAVMRGIVPDFAGESLLTSETIIERMKQLAANERNRLIGSLEAILAQSPAPPFDSDGDACMTWDEVLQLRHGGVEFGSHTSTHEILPNVAPAVAVDEIVRSRSAIQEKLGKCAWFSYPNGSWSPEVRGAVAGAGYQFAFTNRVGAWLKETDPFTIPRVNIWEGSVVDLRNRFSGATFRYAAIWRAYRALPSRRGSASASNLRQTRP